MRRHFALVFVIAVLVCPAIAKSKGDWSDVRKISRGTLIQVKAWRNAKCEFRDATDDKLICDNPWSGEVLNFNRRDVRQIRREFTIGTNGEIGAAVGAGIGAAALAALHSDRSGYTRGGDAIFGALAGGVGGWFVARNAPIFHGGVTYKR